MEVFRNQQWLVTDEGIDRADGQSSYWIGIGRVFESDDYPGPPKLYNWPPHMAKKIWVNVGMFNEAFEQAIRFQADRGSIAVDESMLAASYAEADRLRGARNA
ncbi:hypothetical protein [Sphingomonas sp. UYEF23]|uniref:hypothetical protein n=1 Tax=Sphingomonas sp. UYEF23 TaxID=1756408 RepID=UPI0033956EF5